MPADCFEFQKCYLERGSICVQAVRHRPCHPCSTWKDGACRAEGVAIRAGDLELPECLVQARQLAIPINTSWCMRGGSSPLASTVKMPLSGVPPFPIVRSTYSDIPLIG